MEHPPDHAKTKSLELEITIAPLKLAIGWEVLCWIGHRRCSRHWSITQIQAEFMDACAIKLSADAIVDHIQRSQVMLGGGEGLTPIRPLMPGNSGIVGARGPGGSNWCGGSSRWSRARACGSKGFPSP